MLTELWQEHFKRTEMQIQVKNWYILLRLAFFHLFWRSLFLAPAALSKASAFFSLILSASFLEGFSSWFPRCTVLFYMKDLEGGERNSEITSKVLVAGDQLWRFIYSRSSLNLVLRVSGNLKKPKTQQGFLPPAPPALSTYSVCTRIISFLLLMT